MWDNVTKKILVVDDDPLIHQMVNSVLEKDNYAVHNAGNVAEAIKILEADSFDVVLTDIVMPGADGTKLMKYVRDKHPETLVLAMTGGMENALDDYEIFASFFSDHTLTKPFTKKDLLSAINLNSG